MYFTNIFSTDLNKTTIWKRYLVAQNNDFLTSKTKQLKHLKKGSLIHKVYQIASIPMAKTCGQLYFQSQVREINIL